MSQLTSYQRSARVRSRLRLRRAQRDRSHPACEYLPLPLETALGSMSRVSTYSRNAFCLTAALQETGAECAQVASECAQLARWHCQWQEQQAHTAVRTCEQLALAQ